MHGAPPRSHARVGDHEPGRAKGQGAEGELVQVHEVRLDCDGDTLLVVVDQEGAACHTGDHTCFDADRLL